MGIKEGRRMTPEEVQAFLDRRHASSALITTEPVLSPSTLVEPQLDSLPAGDDHLSPTSPDATLVFDVHAIPNGVVDDDEPFIKPSFKISPKRVEAMLTLDPSHPDFPLSREFEFYYGMLTGDENNYQLKHSVTVAVIPSYQNLRYLEKAFVPLGDVVSPEVEVLKEDIRLRVREELIQRGNKKEQKKAEEELEDFAKQVVRGETLNTHEFRTLVGLFGSSNAVDILYRTRPEFRGIPVDQVKSILADFLGEFLLVKRPFNPDDIETGLSHLSNPNLREGLLAVIKESCLAFYNHHKKAGTQQADEELIAEYFDIVDLEIERFESKAVRAVVDQAREYYASLKATQKPDYIVDSLKIGRAFPDKNQQINMKELDDKKKVLIADEMGLGKSAAPILFKESRGLRQAVIVAPSNVIPTWQRYLSDNPELGGYFKPGQAPKVLVVDTPQVLETPNVASYDYVIVSQERLTDRYTSQLERLDFDLLVVDEVHKLKNLKEGERAAHIVRLAANIEGDNKYLALLSGTPVPNKVEDVAMILKLLYPERFADIDNTVLVRSIIYGDLVDLRSLLIPRMQMKSLTESIEIPELSEEVVEVELSPLEKEVYEMLLEEDELTPSDKMRVLRQFDVNPDLLDTTPGIPSSKIKAVEAVLKKTFATKDKVVMFVNGFIEDVIRGEKAIFDQISLPDEVQVRLIAGGVSSDLREQIQRELNNSDGKILLLVSGQTADVGVDFSGAHALDFYNEPWTQFDKRQQIGRGYREGLKHPLTSRTFIVRGTIEQGIHEYLAVKERAIEKLLRGIPIADLEKELLEKSEDQPAADLEVNPELARYYYSARDRLMLFFSHARALGETGIIDFLANYGKEYADHYTEMGARSYQANVSRVSATLIDTFVRERKQAIATLQILDIASGPEMLRVHSREAYQRRIFSVDINAHHFAGADGTRQLVGSFLHLPFANEVFDYINLSLAWHQTSFAPSRGDYERLAVLAQANRVLKTGGHLVINELYSETVKNREKFQAIAHALGFRVVEEYSAEAEAGNNYKSHVITLEKVGNIEGNITTAIESAGKEYPDGAKFVKTKQRIKDSRRIITEFDLAGRSIPISFNQNDREVLAQEQKILQEGELLKQTYGGIESIPRQEIIGKSFVRVLVGKRYILFKKLTHGSGAIVIK